MTAGLYVTGTHVTSVEKDPPRGTLNRGITRQHAVARPAVAGLAASECGLLVTAIADVAWNDLRTVLRCEDCQRIVAATVRRP